MNIKFILGDSNWKFVQVGYPVDTPVDTGKKGNLILINSDLNV